MNTHIHAAPSSLVLSTTLTSSAVVPNTHEPRLPAAATRPLSYSGNHCSQHEGRLNNRAQDLIDARLSAEEAAAIKVKDLTFRFVDKSETVMCKRIVAFIERHEWLGTMPLHPTHRFIAEYKGHLAGVIIFSMPSAFSKLLGEHTKDLERVISRGACISWSPKCTASSLIMWAIDWMKDNTQFRLFTCYADTEAGEVGQIYQACNFIYLGQSSGTQKMYSDPKKPERGYFSDRSFRSRSAWKRYAKALGIEWQPEWQSEEKLYWKRIPEDVSSMLREFSKAEQARCEYRIVPRKHKYAMIRGKDRRETRQLTRQFEKLNPKLLGLVYPKREVSEVPQEDGAVASQ